MAPAQFRLLAWLLAVSTVFGAGVYTGHRWQAGKVADMRLEAARAETERAAAAAFASEAAREAEQARVDAVDAVSKAYERGKSDAKAVADRTTRDLRAGNVRLRTEIRALATRGLPGDPATAGEPDGAAERGAALAGTALGVGTECDARIAALIRAYEAVRTQP